MIEKEPGVKLSHFTAKFKGINKILFESGILIFFLSFYMPANNLSVLFISNHSLRNDYLVPITWVSQHFSFSDKKTVFLRTHCFNKFDTSLHPRPFKRKTSVSCVLVLHHCYNRLSGLSNAIL